MLNIKVNSSAVLTIYSLTSIPLLVDRLMISYQKHLFPALQNLFIDMVVRFFVLVNVIVCDCQYTLPMGLDVDTLCKQYADMVRRYSTEERIQPMRL